MKIKVLHLIKSLGRGGAETLLPETLHAHDKNQFEFHYIYFLPWKNQLVSRIEEEGGLVSNFPAKNNIQLIFQTNKVIEYIKEHQIDIVHCHLPWAGFLGRIIYFKVHVPVIYTEHNKQERYHWITKLLNKWTFRFQSTVIAVSKDVAQSIHKNIPNSIPVKVIANGVDTDKFDRTHWINHTETQRTDFVIGTVAVFRFQKRLTLWLEVFKKISDQHPHVKGVIVGDGPLRIEIEAKIKELHLEDKIQLAGLQTEVRPWLASMDVFMMTSIFEGLPIALLEAMSMGCAPVTTMAGGIGEVIVQGESGFLVPIDEWVKIADGVNEWIENPILLEKIKREARSRVQQHFSMQQMVASLENMYSTTLQERRK